MLTLRAFTRAGVVLACCAWPVFGQVTVVIDFETTDGGAALLNGEAIDGATLFPFVQIEAVASDENLGHAIFDSDPSGPNMDAIDQDLLVDSDNILILQSPDYPAQTTAGFFDEPNDALNGGTTLFSFMVDGGVHLSSIDIIDLDHAESVVLTLTAANGNTLEIHLPAGFTGNGGQRTVDFEPEGTFDISSIVALEVQTNGSGAVDNLTFTVGEGEECNADAMCDDDILCTADSCEDGVCVNEEIPGCEECEGLKLFLAADNGIIGPGEVLKVDIVMSCSQLPIVGGQFFLEYDPYDLTFVEHSPGDSPFEIEILEDIDGATGLIDYAVHVPFDAPGVSEPTVIATLTFVATNDCDHQTAVACRDNNPPTRLTTEGGDDIQPECNEAQIRVACFASASGEDGDAGGASRVKSRRVRRTYEPFPIGIREEK